MRRYTNKILLGRLATAEAMRTKSILGKTTTQAAIDAERRADDLEFQIAKLNAENNALLEKLGERQRFKERMAELTLQALKTGAGRGEELEPVSKKEKKGIVAMLRAEIAMGGGIPSTIKAGGSGISEESNGIVDPMMPIRIHKTRPLTNPTAVTNLLENNVAIGSAHMNEIVLVGKVVKGAPVFGHLDGRVDLSNTDDYFKTAGLQVSAQRNAAAAVNAASSSAKSSDQNETELDNGDVPFPIPVLQFTLRQIGFRPLGIYPATLRPALNYFTIQARAPFVSSDIREGDTVVVKGHYGLHALFQLDTSSWQTHPTVDVGPSGFLGKL